MNKCRSMVIQALCQSEIVCTIDPLEPLFVSLLRDPCSAILLVPSIDDTQHRLDRLLGSSRLHSPAGESSLESLHQSPNEWQFLGGRFSLVSKPNHFLIQTLLHSRGFSLLLTNPGEMDKNIKFSSLKLAAYFAMVMLSAALEMQ